MQGVNCTRHYPYLNEEVLHPVHRPVDGVVVALVGDVVLASRPCWLHITREGLCWLSHYSRASAKWLDQADANGCFWHLYFSQVCPLWLSVSRANTQALTCPFETE